MSARRWLIGMVVLLSASARQGNAPPVSPMIDAMHHELARNMTALRRQPVMPYFLSYEVREQHAVTIRSTFGAITQNQERRGRAVVVDLRVGTPALDNTHARRGEVPDLSDFMDFGGAIVEVPIDDDTAALKAVLWTETDRKYRRATRQLASARANAEVSVQPEDTSPDFSVEPAEQHEDTVVSLALDTAAWERKLRSYTAPFRRYADIYDADATLDAAVETRWYVNSEGATIQTSQPIYRLYLSAFSKAADGMELPRYESFMSFTLQGLPDDSTVLKAVNRMVADLHALQIAPMVDPYTGPAILSGRASAVFFHEVFGHRIEGHRQKREDEGQTFKRAVNQAVLPPGFSVYSDPTLTRLGATDLAGSYRYDDEGVAAQRVTIVQGGILKNFLMSRSPIEGFSHSNGHGRSEIGLTPVARQSNLIVQAAVRRSHAQLKGMLLAEIKRQHKPFGLLFDDIEGGFTITGRGLPNAFAVLPIMVYRVFPDGREELVRGVDLVGTPLTVFSRILAADDQVAVFNGLCGAESGLVPVAAVSPGLLIAQVEVQKKPKAVVGPPILPAPGT